MRPHKAHLRRFGNQADIPDEKPSDERALRGCNRWTILSGQAQRSSPIAAPPPNGAPADSVPNNSPLLAVLESLHRSGKKPLELEWLFFLMAVSIWATKQLTEHLFLTNPEADQDFAA